MKFQAFPLGFGLADALKNNVGLWVWTDVFWNIESVAKRVNVKFKNNVEETIKER